MLNITQPLSSIAVHNCQAKATSEMHLQTAVKHFMPGCATWTVQLLGAVFVSSAYIYDQCTLAI